jgi:sigma-B regulation protein RsbU (phosphoserine phosphatase)
MNEPEELGAILVVDDEPMNRDTLARRLKRRGYRVATAANGRDALETLASTHIDLVLLDIMMPDMDGMEVLGEIRNRRSRTQLPVIMATAKDESRDVVEALKNGANDYVTKPLDLEVVLARVGTHILLKRTVERLELARRRLQKELEQAAWIQQSQLPQPSLRLRGCQVAWAYCPCQELGGDFLNVFNLGQDHIGMYLLDVSGHGTPAALLSVAVSRALMPSDDDTCIVSRPVRPLRKGEPSGLQITAPADVADRLNRRFGATAGTSQFFTIAFAVLVAESGDLTYTLAGHPRPIHLPADSEGRFLEGGGQPIGMVAPDDAASEPYEEQTVKLGPGDRVFFYSDGICEAMNARDEMFRPERVLEAVNHSRPLPLQAGVDALLQAAKEWCDGRDFKDDVSILAIQIEAVDDAALGETTG